MFVFCSPLHPGDFKDKNLQIPPDHFELLHNANYWQKMRILGRGNFTEVSLYNHLATGEKVAVKEVKHDPSDGQTLKNMLLLQGEVEKHKILSHARIVKYLGCTLNIENYTLSVFLEYMSGESIHKCLQNDGRFSERDAKKYTRQMLEGVAFLHKRLIVHRQIRGANVLKDKNDDIKLSDFGLSKHLETPSRGGKTKYTDSYCWQAPELICDVEYGVKVDIWSVGCTMIEMLTTNPPWYPSDTVKTVSAIKNKMYPVYTLPEFTSNEIKNFLLECFIIEPRTRPSAEQLLERFPFETDNMHLI